MMRSHRRSNSREHSFLSSSVLMAGAPDSAPTIGVLGGGQLGRMLAIDARASGLRCVVRTDEQPGGSAAQVADAEFVGPYDDAALNSAFLAACDVVTAEFENLPAALLEALAEHRPVRPSAHSIGICQHRRREKEFLAANAIPHAPFAVVRSAADVVSALGLLGGRGVLKTAAFGYDGRGQERLDQSAMSATEIAAAWSRLGANEAVLEQLIAFEREISVVGARGEDGAWVSYPPGENVHIAGILDHTIAPARIGARAAAEAASIAEAIAAALGHVGTIGVEFFVLTDGSLVVNEMAPRPHNSGHHTLDACSVSQFGQQWRAALGLPLAIASQHTPAVMMNLLGDLWSNGEPTWATVVDDPTVRLHLYGKSGPRPGRKMGHLCVLGRAEESMPGLVDRALAVRAGLLGRRPGSASNGALGSSLEVHPW